MFEWLKKLEILVVTLLCALMAFVLVLAFLELAWLIAVDMISPPVFFLQNQELLDIFGQFLLVIIGFELLESVTKTYLVEKIFRVEVVILVAIIAMARKVIVLDLKETAPVSLIGIGVIIMALIGALYFLKKRAD